MIIKYPTFVECKYAGVNVRLSSLLRNLLTLSAFSLSIFTFIQYISKSDSKHPTIASNSPYQANNKLKPLDIKFISTPRYPFKLFTIPHPSCLINNKTCSRINEIEVTLLILVLSDPTNFERRAAIRATWARRWQIRSRQIQVIFLIGELPLNNAVKDMPTLFNITKKIHLESEEHGDILRGNFIDSYHNLTYKTLMGILWARNILDYRTLKLYITADSIARFVLKIDDDTLPNLGVLFTKLIQFHKSRKFMSRTGYINTTHVIRGPYIKINSSTYALSKPAFYMLCNVAQGWKAIRNNSNKNYLSVEEHTSDTLEPFCPGSAYVIPHDSILLDKLYKLSQNADLIGGMIPNEDLLITGIMTQRLAISLVNLNSDGHRYLDYYTSIFSLHKDILFVSHIPNSHNYLNVWKQMDFINKLDRSD